MRTFLPLLVILAQLSVVGPTQVQDPNYPIRVRILQRNTSRGYSLRTWGRADIVVPKEQGFDYTSDCNDLFMVTQGDELYSARWKKQDLELEMLVSKMGTNKSGKCTLKTDLKPFVYVWRNNGVQMVITTKPMAQ